MTTGPIASPLIRVLRPWALAALKAGRRAYLPEGLWRADAVTAVCRGRWWWIWLVIAGLLAGWVWLS